MPSLRELQSGFAAALLSEAAGAPSAVAAGRFGAERQLQIYRNNVFSNLTGALEAVYPVVVCLVDAKFFGYAADCYIRRSPPSGGNLHDFGDRFADFLATFAPAQTLPYLPDVARLEWACHRAFHAADAQPLALDRLATVAPDDHARVTFTLHPSAHVMRSDYPVSRIWQANQLGSAPDEVINLDEGGTQFLVVRRDLEVAIEPLAIGEFALLREFARGSHLAVAAEAALTTDPTFDLTAALATHVARQTLCDFTLHNNLSGAKL